MPELTKEQMVKDEEAQAQRALVSGGFGVQTSAAILRAIRHTIVAENLRQMDARLLEGDDELEIRGY